LDVTVGLLIVLPTVHGDVLYDTLYITDQYLYDTGNGDAWSGRGVFGMVFNLQVVDDFPGGAGGQLTAATADYLSFFGRTPADGVTVSLFGSRPPRYGKLAAPSADQAMMPKEEEYATQLSKELRVTYFEDPVFGSVGIRIRAQTNLQYGNGTQWVLIQPKDTTNQGDWYYIVVDWDRQVGLDRYLREPEGHNYWWISGRHSGYGAGPVAMKLEGTPIPEPWLLALVCLGLAPLLRRR
jgi:MYXO-CTERM domain-containing protein